eukprot:5479613-Alexandrium_andersonii.AAC.1
MRPGTSAATRTHRVARVRPPERARHYLNSHASAHQSARGAASTRTHPPTRARAAPGARAER